MQSPNASDAPAGIIIGCVAILFIGFPLAIAFARRLLRVKPGVSPDGIAELTARMARVEQAVEAVAIEVERISEGQRFTTKLLTERSAPRHDPPS